MTQADLLVLGRVVTLGGEAGLGIVDAVAVADGRVIAAGSRSDVEAFAGPRTRRLDLAPDEIALPGLTDSHIHLADAAVGRDDVDLESAVRPDDALMLVAAADARLAAGSWLRGHGWDPDRWGGWPLASDLERAAPGRRCAFWAHDHHSLWASEAALAAAGLDADTPDPPGGIIRRSDDGRPTGVLHETAARLVTTRIPMPTVDDLERALPTFGRDLLEVGIVAVHDLGWLVPQVGLGPAIDAYRHLADAGALPVRVHASVRAEQLGAAIDAGLRSGAPLGREGGRATVGWLKLFADGTLSSRTAALLDPIEPEPDRPLPAGAERGVWVMEPEELARLTARAASAGITTTIHAIGDRAVRAALDALAPTAAMTPLVPRLEHVQLAHPDDVPRFAQLGVAASVQPVHLRSDAAAARRLWGARAERHGYAWRTLLGAGALITFGTDAPVEPIDPWPGLAMAITRSDVSWPAGTRPFGPDQALTLDEVLRAACLAPAMAAGERDRGRLSPGQRADIVIVPRASLEGPVRPGGPLATTRPTRVLLDGEVAWEA
jgi:hypothetical protein